MTPRRLEEVDAALARGEPAAPFLVELLAHRPLSAQVLRRVASVLLILHQWPRAVAAMRLASALHPEDAALRVELGTVLSAGAAYEAAQRCYDEALRLQPEDNAALFARAQGFHLLCEFDEALRDYDEVLRRHPETPQARSFRMVALNYREEGQARILAEAKAYGELLGGSVNRPDGSGQSRRRVGILSSDLRSHAVTFFLRPLLERIPEDVEVRLFGDSLHEDATTAELAALVTKAGAFCVSAYGNVQALSNEALEKLLILQELDVIIDLTGHFARHRLPIFAHRVAPVQISYLGYPNTTGVKAMDWRIGDDVIDAGSVDDWTERLTTLRAGMLAYAPPPDSPPINPELPAVPTLGYFGQIGKVSPACARTWAKILDQVPAARLLIKGDGFGDQEVCQRWLARWAAWGLPKDRLILRGRTPDRASHLAMYGDCTVSLDTWPYNGTTTVCESLWMGVPVVALRGSRHASRVTAALVSGMGLGEGTVAQSEEEYVIAAVQSLTSPVRLTRKQLKKAKWLQHDAVAEEFWKTVLSLRP